MDYLRSCYKASMRLYSDRPDVLTPGEWHFCQEGAKLAQMPHAFGSQIWTPKGMVIDPSIGEVLGQGPWVNGEPNSRYVGQHFCGSADVWLHGIPYADRPGLVLEPDGTPACCHAPPAVPRFTSGGELAIDGEAEGGDVFSGAKATSGNLLPLSLGTVGVTFTSVLWDTDNYFDLVGNPFLLTVPRDGVYLVGSTVQWLWLGPPNAGVTVILTVRHASGSAVNETSVVVDSGNITTLAQQSPANAVRLYPELPCEATLTIEGGNSNLVDLRATLWVEFRSNPPPITFPLVTEGGDQLVTGDGDSLMGVS
jgi:hypothetical protein